MDFIVDDTRHRTRFVDTCKPVDGHTIIPSVRRIEQSDRSSDAVCDDSGLAFVVCTRLIRCDTLFRIEYCSPLTNEEVDVAIGLVLHDYQGCDMHSFFFFLRFFFDDFCLRSRRTERIKGVIVLFSDSSEFSL